MLEQIEKLLQELDSFQSETLQEIEDFRIKMLGKKGDITALFGLFKQVPPEQKKSLVKNSMN